MAEYIDRGALIAAIVEVRNKIPLRVPCAPYELLDDRPWSAGQNQRGGIRKALRCVNDAPAVDAVEVCRCKDCKWGVKDSCDISYQCTIDAEYDEDLGGYVGFVEWHKAEHFCSYGERKGDDGD